MVRMQVKNGNWDANSKAAARVQVSDGGGFDTLKVWSEEASLKGQCLKWNKKGEIHAKPGKEPSRQM